MYYICRFCNIFVYNTEEGDIFTELAPRTYLSDIPTTWSCPICGKPKDFLIKSDVTAYNKKVNNYWDLMKRNRDHIPSLRELLERYKKQ